MAALSNGLSLMGRLKLEHGMFRLLDNGLLPFSAAMSTLSLIKNLPSTSNSGRINDLLMQRHVDVDLAERMLGTWHDLHNLKLLREHSFPIDQKSDQMLFLDPGELTAGERHHLKEALESVAIIQRHVEIMFSEMGA
jgi:signal-transduction protein with cAMP-binding, CBS, and nucleotidyltransferase domain